MAAVTTTLRFMTGVIILPLRDPFVLAKQVATFNSMSGGRVELGIGVGWLKEEFEAMGVPFEKRGKRSDEYIAVMRKLWAEEGASFKGEFVSFDEVSSNPKPVIARSRSSSAAIRRQRPGAPAGWGRLLPLDRLASRYRAAVRRRAAHGRSRRPRFEVGRDHGRLPRPASGVDEGSARCHRRTSASGRRAYCAARLALPAGSGGEPQPLRRDCYSGTPITRSRTPSFGGDRDQTGGWLGLMIGREVRRSLPAPRRRRRPQRAAMPRLLPTARSAPNMRSTFRRGPNPGGGLTG